MGWLKPLGELRSADRPQFGGKAAALGEMVAAGLPVPPGYAVSVDAWNRFREGVTPDGLGAELGRAYATLDSGPVAVRSSATAEDGDAQSFAGQAETVLWVEGIDALLDAVRRCWQSLDAVRVAEYRAAQGVAGPIGMGVVVQKMIDAESAGVMFTRDPASAESVMVVEASYGLGDSVVSGAVEPDRFTLRRDDGTVGPVAVGSKLTRIDRRGRSAVSESERRKFCLTPSQPAQLWRLGTAVAKHFGDERDIEWAFDRRGALYVLQSRPITTGMLDREAIRREEVERVRVMAQGGPTVWARGQVSEVLPEPTPLSWSCADLLLGGTGGTGHMYRSFGFTPHPSMSDRSAYDLIAGRPYLNLRLEPLLQAARPLYAYPIDLYRADPTKAANPAIDSSRRLVPWWRMFGAMFGMFKSYAAIRKAMGGFTERFETVVSKYVGETERTVSADVESMSAAALVEAFEAECRRSLVEFAGESLKPTLFAQLSVDVLQRQLTPRLGAAEAARVVGTEIRRAKPKAGADLADALNRFNGGTLLLADFLKDFGHRAPREMELSAPRFAERPPVANGAASSASEADGAGWADAMVKLSAAARKVAESYRQQAVEFVGWRETAKHHLMRGYAVLRRIALTLDAKLNLGGGVFEATREELPAVARGVIGRDALLARRRRRIAVQNLEVPPVIVGDDPEAVGRPAPLPPGADVVEGSALSPGVVEGPAFVALRPEDCERGLPEGSILVCPSTDPSWVPAFARVRGLVLETGGILSHGAIVAREFGKPAVGGVSSATRRFQTGEQLRVDGNAGRVTRLRNAIT